MNRYEKEEQKQITRKIRKLQGKHPGTRWQRLYHGDYYSVQFIDKSTGQTVADYTLKVKAHVEVSSPRYARRGGSLVDKL